MKMQVCHTCRTQFTLENNNAKVKVLRRQQAFAPIRRGHTHRFGEGVVPQHGGRGVVVLTPVDYHHHGKRQSLWECPKRGGAWGETNNGGEETSAVCPLAPPTLTWNTSSLPPTLNWDSNRMVNFSSVTDSAPRRSDRLILFRDCRRGREAREA